MGLKHWVTKQRIKFSKKNSELTHSLALNEIRTRKEELLRELKKTKKEFPLDLPGRYDWTVVAIGKNPRFGFKKVKKISDYHIELNLKDTTGYFTYKTQRQLLLVNDIVVGNFYGKSSLRQLGIGTLLIDIAKEIAKKKRCRALRLTAEPDLEEFYKKRGFVTLATKADKSKLMIFFIDPLLETRLDPEKPWKIYDYLK